MSKLEKQMQAWEEAQRQLEEARAQITKLEAQLRQSNRLEAVGQLAARVAHEFNNILTIIGGYTSLLLSQKNLPGTLARPLEKISLATERATQLTRQLLTFSRQETTQLSALDLNELILRVAKMLSPTLGKEINLRCLPAENLPLIQAEAGMIEQVVLNLAVNARDAMPEGGELIIATAPVQIEADDLQRNPQARIGAFVRLTVTDTGSGIEPEIMSKMFEPFFTTKAPGKGTGLGLATVSATIKQHHGWIEVESIPSEGAQFRVFLPVSPKPEELPVSVPAKPKMPRGSETIFVVEDEPALRDLTQRVLRQYGYQVVTADSGVAALTLWPQCRDQIDLLLTDLVMPHGVSGWELAQRLQADRADLKVIYTSGYSPELVDQNFSQAAATHFLLKPYLPSKLLQAVRESLDE